MLKGMTDMNPRPFVENRVSRCPGWAYVDINLMKEDLEMDPFYPASANIAPVNMAPANIAPVNPAPMAVAPMPYQPVNLPYHHEHCCPCCHQPLQPKANYPYREWYWY
jgi:hypothetical protein